MKTLNDLRAEKMPDDEKALRIIKSEYVCLFNNERYKISIILENKFRYRLVLTNLTTGLVEKISDSRRFKSRKLTFFDYIDSLLYWWAYENGFNPDKAIKEFEIISK